MEQIISLVIVGTLFTGVAWSVELLSEEQASALLDLLLGKADR